MKICMLLCAALLLAAPAGAQEAATGWRMLAEADAEAAIALIEQNHPGAAPELGDTAFRALLATAKAHVAERLAKVDGFGAYSALMQGLATDLRDGHIWSNPTNVGWVTRRWAGLVIVRRGGEWVVGAQRPGEGEPDLTDATLVACDGKSADGWARDRLGRFGANPGVEASLARRAPALLLDDANPFLVRPATCDFSREGAPVSLTLQWRPIAQGELQAVVGEALRPARAGMGVSSFPGGYWIALETLGDRAEALVGQVKAQQAALRAAPMVVVDLRGNGGGNSEYADAIARLLAGDARVARARGRPAACSGAFWRASPDNLAAMQQLSQRGGALADFLREPIAAMETALAAGHGFAPELPACAKGTRAATRSLAKLPASAMRGRLVLVTDRSCFSSCLIATKLFRALGALHVGETTDVSTRYMEVREIVLPSGLRTFSTLQKVAVGAEDFGPFVPERPFPGALSDGEALKAWVAKLP